MIFTIVQARMGSTRLPGKVLLEHKGRTMLEVLHDRIASCRNLGTFILATSIDPRDDAIVALAERKGWRTFRGSEEDCLDRYYRAATTCGAKSGDIVVRVTGDCPLVDPSVFDATIDLFRSDSYDYVANNVPPESRKFPDGADVEVMAFDALASIWRETSDSHQREHVTFPFWRGQGKFRTTQLTHERDLSSTRITLDYPEDFKVITYILDLLEERQLQGTVDEIADLLAANDSIRILNAHHFFGEGWKRKSQENLNA